MTDGRRGLIPVLASLFFPQWALVETALCTDHLGSSQSTSQKMNLLLYLSLESTSNLLNLLLLLF